MLKFFIKIFIVITVCSLASCDGETVQPKPISADTASLLMEKVKNKEWLLIDVRTPEEFAQGHIPGAINMPHDKIEAYVSQLDDRQHKPVVVYCRSGRRAKLALESLKSRSFTDVSHLEGDMMGWSAAGLPVDRM